LCTGAFQIPPLFKHGGQLGPCLEVIGLISTPKNKDGGTLAKERASPGGPIKTQKRVWESGCPLDTVIRALQKILTGGGGGGDLYSRFSLGEIMEWGYLGGIQVNFLR